MIKSFDSFSCPKNKDVADFLTNKCIDFEKRNKSRTYIIIDNEKLEQKELSILGYFSLALKSLTIYNELVSPTLRKKMDGFCTEANDFETFLIGQLGRNNSVTNKELPGKDILNMATSFIDRAQEFVGGRVIMIDCEDNKKIIAFCEANNFKYIQKHNTKENLIQMIKTI